VTAAQAIGDSTNTFVDAPDHGESQGISLTLEETGDELADIAFGKVLVGYSMGARMSLHAVLQHPFAMTGLVLVSGTPGIEVDSERAAREQADEELASRIESIGTSAFIQEWIRQPLFANSRPFQKYTYIASNKLAQVWNWPARFPMVSTSRDQYSCLTDLWCT
jgi:pimeloyl-ACP methyl ester carboxylesterase